MVLDSTPSIEESSSFTWVCMNVLPPKSNEVEATLISIKGRAAAAAAPAVDACGAVGILLLSKDRDPSVGCSLAKTLELFGVVVVVLKKGVAVLEAWLAPNNVSATPLVTPAAKTACRAFTVVAELVEELLLVPLLLLVVTASILLLVVNKVSSE